MHFSSSLPLITVEPLACLSSTSPFSSSLTALLLLTNLIDLDNLNVTSPASFISLMRRGLQPQGARLMWENECRWHVIGCFVAVAVNAVVVVYKKRSSGCSWSQLTVGYVSNKGYLNMSVTKVTDILRCVFESICWHSEQKWSQMWWWCSLQWAACLTGWLCSLSQ